MANAERRITAVRYADIQDEHGLNAAPKITEVPEVAVPNNVNQALESYSSIKESGLLALQEEVENLKRLVEEIRRERKRPEYIDSDSPFSATDALSEAYDILIQSGVERRFAVQIMREVARNLSVESRAESEAVLDAIATELLKRTDIRPYFNKHILSGEQSIRAVVGVSGSGKTACVAKLATHAARSRNEKVGLIRIRLLDDEAQDPLVIFAKALHIPYRLVSNAEELGVAIQDMSRVDRIFIDTPGLSPRDLTLQKKLKAILQAVPKIHVDLVVSATTRDLELHEQGKVFSILNPETIFFTRLDETYSFGCIYSLSQRLRLPVSIFVTGKKVTADWENASAERLTASILNIV